MAQRFTDAYKGPGDVLDVLAPYAREAGQGALVGFLFGVSCSNAANGAAMQLKMTGEFLLDKVSAQAWTSGAKIYWDDSAKNLTTTSSGNTYVGNAVGAAANPSAQGRVRLLGVAI